ncbi:uncharacterized protein LOC115257643 [Aedes albopictus]|uniref:NACHT domain-containing protein n=1 Tax=Aedes albopictus TaxID=7160 RepID=A0ABM1ZU18_AEDAL
MACSKLDVIDPESTALVTYESSIKSGTHGDVYQKQLAQLLLLRLTREERNFNLAYELTSADKFDDVVLYDKVAKQWTFLQSKHVDGKDSKIDLNGLLPEANREKGDFSLYKYFTSYMLIRNRFKGKLKFLLFTNKKLDEKLKTAGNHMSINDQEVHEHLRFTFEGATHKVITPTESTIQSIMEYANKDLHALKDAIKELFTKGIITKELQKHKEYLRDILKESENNRISFKNSFNDSLIFIAKLYKVLQPELQDFKPIDKPQALDMKEVEFVYSSCPPDEGQDFEQLIDAIKNVFRTGIVTDSLKKYENLIALILTTANGQLAFKHTFNCDVVFKAELYRMLRNELRAMNEEVTTKQKLFDGKDSRNKPHSALFYVDASDVRDFFKHLTLSVHQPDELEPFIVEELHLWMRQWLRPDVLGKLTEVDDKNAVRDLDDYFDTTMKREQGNSKPYLGPDFVAEYSNKLRSKIKELHPESKDINQLYINRVLLFEKGDIDAPEVLQDSQFDGNVESELYRSSGETIPHYDNTAKDGREVDEKLSDKKTYEEITDRQFAANLRIRFSQHQCLVLTADPGIGKTELLQYVALEHQKLTSGAVFLFYLNRIQDVKDIMTNESPLDMIKSALSPSNVKLIQDVLNNKSNGHITILFDGYDEVHEKNEERMHNLFKLLLKSKYIRLVVSARNHKKNSLKNFLRMHKFNVGYSTLQPFNSGNITEYLARSWMENLECDINSKFYTYSKFLIDKFYSLCSVPLMVKMMSEIYKTGFEQFKASYIKDKESEISYLQEEFLEVDHIYEIFIKNCLLLKVKDVCNGVGVVSSNNQILEANVNAVDRNEYTPIHWACISGHKEVVEILISKKANVEALDQNNFTPLHLACLNDHKEVVEILIREKVNIGALTNKKCTPLHLACQNGHTEVVEILIKEKANIEIFNQDNFTPLHLASLNGHEEVVEILIKKKANIEAFNQENGTPLHLASWNGHKEVVEILIRENVNIGVLTNKKFTPLHLACANGHTEVVELLIREKANIETLDQDNCTPLHLACMDGHEEVVEILIRKKANIDALDQQNWTPLHWACQNGHKEIVEILIREKVNIDALTKKKSTPLHLASWNGHKEVVEILIRKKANIEALDKDNCTPLHLASWNGHREVVEILTREKANIEALDQDNSTPLHLASWNGHKEVVEILTREKANIDALDQQNWTPLHWACQDGHEEVVKILIRKNVNIEAFNQDNSTPLHLASRNGHKAVVEILIRENVNIGALTNKKSTPLHLACQNGHAEVVQILIREKANIETLDQDNCTPLHLACLDGHKEVVEILIREKANIDALDQQNWTPLHFACRSGNKEIVEILLREKANIDTLNDENCTPLDLTCQYDHKEVEKVIKTRFNPPMVNRILLTLIKIIVALFVFYIIILYDCSFWSS